MNTYMYWYKYVKSSSSEKYIAHCRKICVYLMSNLGVSLMENLRVFDAGVLHIKSSRAATSVIVLATLKYSQTGRLHRIFRQRRLVCTQFVCTFRYTLTCVANDVDAGRLSPMFSTSLRMYCAGRLVSVLCGYMRGGGLGSRPIFKKFHETYAPS